MTSEKYKTNQIKIKIEKNWCSSAPLFTVAAISDVVVVVVAVAVVVVASRIAIVIAAIVASAKS